MLEDFLLTTVLDVVTAATGRKQHPERQAGLKVQIRTMEEDKGD